MRASIRPRSWASEDPVDKKTVLEYWSFVKCNYLLLRLTAEMLLHVSARVISFAWRIRIGNSSCGQLVPASFQQTFSTRGAGVAQWWALASLQCGLGSIPDLASYIRWVCCWFSSLLRGFFSAFSCFPFSTKMNSSKFQFNWKQCT